jgi:hypothetical protein
MSMDRSFHPPEWKPEASAGKHSQVGMPLLAAVPAPQLIDAGLLPHLSFSGALNEAAKHSLKDDQKIAEEIHISPGYMSRFMRGVGQQWAKRLVAFMQRTNSRAPLQWIAHQVGCDIVPLDARAAEVATLRARLREMGEAA